MQSYFRLRGSGDGIWYTGVLDFNTCKIKTSNVQDVFFVSTAVPANRNINPCMCVHN